MTVRTRPHAASRQTPIADDGPRVSAVDGAGMPIVVHADDSYTGQVQNLGRNGLSVTIGTTLAVDRMVELEFHLPTSGKVLRVLGQVRWARRANGALGSGSAPKVGIEFRSVGPELRAYLTRMACARRVAVDC